MKIKPPSTENIERVADWVELFVLVNKKEISKSKIIALFNSGGVTVEEEDVDSAIGELSRRLSLYGDVKPYKIQGNRILPTFDWKKYPEHALCLFYSTYGVGKTPKGGKADKGTKLFEDITKSCLDKLFSTESYPFGFPATKSFKSQLDEFAVLVNEQRYDNPGKYDKDRDVDLVVYKRLDNIRSNCLLFFVQCAAGKNWNDKKPVPITSYRRYISFNSSTAVPSLATAQLISIDEWSNACDDYGVVIDRARLFKISSTHKNTIPAALKRKLQDWFKTKLN